MSDELPQKPSKPKRLLSQEVGAKAARKLRARRHVTRTVWFGLGMMGLIGWSVAIPTLMFHRYLSSRVGRLAIAMEEQALKLVEVMKGERTGRAETDQIGL